MHSTRPNEVSGNAPDSPEGIIRKLSPLPKSDQIRQRKRRAEVAEVLSSTPCKQRLIQHYEARTKTETKNLNKSIGLKNCSKGKGKANLLKAPKKKLTIREDKQRGRRKVNLKQADKKSGITVCKKKQEENREVGKEKVTACLICKELCGDNADGETWI